MKDQIRSAALKTPLARLGDRGRAATKSMGWMGSAQATGVVVRLASNLLLTRLLAPEAFALVGTALAVLAVLEWLSDLGLQPAVIRHQRGAEPGFVSTAWWLGLVRGCVLTAAGMAVAWPLAAFYESPGLAAVLAVMSVRPLTLALRSPAYPLLRREMNYRALFWDEMTQIIVGTAVTVMIAIATRSVMSIAIGVALGGLLSVIVSWCVCPMRPGRPNRVDADVLLRFSGPVLLNTLVMACWLNLDRLVGLKLLPADEVGLYVLAFNLAGAAEALVVRGGDVYFSSLSRVPECERDLWHARQMRRMVKWLMPLGAIAIAVAAPAVSLLYDVRYEAAGPLLAVLVARLMIRGYGQMRFQHLLSQDRVRVATVAYAIALGLHIAMIGPMVARFGVMGLAVSAFVSTLAVTFVQEVTVAWCRAWTRRDEWRPLAYTMAWSAIALLATGWGR